MRRSLESECIPIDGSHPEGVLFVWKFVAHREFPYDSTVIVQEVLHVCVGVSVLTKV